VSEAPFETYERECPITAKADRQGQTLASVTVVEVTVELSWTRLHRPCDWMLRREGLTDLGDAQGASEGP
jgi:hypothetical protein